MPTENHKHYTFTNHLITSRMCEYPKMNVHSKRKWSASQILLPLFVLLIFSWAHQESELLHRFACRCYSGAAVTAWHIANVDVVVYTILWAIASDVWLSGTRMRYSLHCFTLNILCSHFSSLLLSIKMKKRLQWVRGRVLVCVWERERDEPYVITTNGLTICMKMYEPHLKMRKKSLLLFSVYLNRVVLLAEE